MTISPACFTRPTPARPRRALLVLASLLLLTTSVSTAQTVGGTVYDVDGTPLSGVTVFQFVDDLLRSADVTDDRGVFRVTVEEGVSALVLRLQRAGYGVVEVDIANPDSATALSIILRQTSIVLPNVDVEARTRAQLALAGFGERRAQGRGKFFDAEETDRWRASGMAGLTRRVPFLTMSNQRPPRTSVTRTRRVQARSLSGTLCDPTIFIDGLRIADGGYEQFVPADLRAVEAYQLPLAAPEPFGSIAANLDARCGVILMWTAHLADR